MRAGLTGPAAAAVCLQHVTSMATSRCLCNGAKRHQRNHCHTSSAAAAKFGDGLGFKNKKRDETQTRSHLFIKTAAGQTSRTIFAMRVVTVACIAALAVGSSAAFAPSRVLSLRSGNKASLSPKARGPANYAPMRMVATTPPQVGPASALGILFRKLTILLYRMTGWHLVKSMDRRIQLIRLRKRTQQDV